MKTRLCFLSCWLVASLALLVFTGLPAKAEEVAGTTEASFSVSPDGNATYSVPLMVPPGTAGVEPSLALVYSSQGGPSPFGFGWSLSGLSQIQRGPKNIADDGIVEGVELLASDAFYLDGEKLVEVESAQPDVREFRTRIESYSRVRAYDWSEQGPAYFVVETRAGLTMTYGMSVRARVGIGADQRTLSWLLEKVEDRSGNYMALTYQSASLGGPQSLDYVIDTVDYTGNTAQGLEPYAKIRFTFRSLPDEEAYGQRYVMGQSVSMRRQLEFVESSYRGEFLRRYTPSYRGISDSDRFFTIASLSEEAGGLSYAPLKFEYPSSDPAWLESDLMQGIDDLPDLAPIIGNVPQAYRYADLPKGTGTVPAILVAAQAAGQSISEAFVYNSTTGTWDKEASFKPPVNLALEDGVNRSVLVADIDRDGDDDLVLGDAADAGAARTYLATATGWSEVDPFPVDIRSATLAGNGLLAVDIVDRNGDRQTAFAWDHVDPISGSRRRDVRRWDGDRWANVRRYRTPLLLSAGGSRHISGVRSVDVDCDGITELVYFDVIGKAGGPAVYRATIRGWRLESEPAFQPGIPQLPADAALKLTDLNRDGCTDIAYSFDDGTGLISGVRLASASGWIDSPRDFNNVAFWRASVAGEESVAGDLFDIDGDARPDLIEGVPRAYRTYRASGDTWVADSKLNPDDVALGETREDRALSSARLRLAGQGGWIWLDLRPREGALSPNVLRYDPALGWQLDAELDPPVDIAKFDKVDLGVRFLDLNNDGLPDLVWSMRKKSGNSLERGTYLFRPGSGSPWTKDERFALPVELSREDFRATGTVLADLNGDGVVDILHARGATSIDLTAGTREAYINCSNMERCADVPEDSVSGYWLKASEIDGLRGLVPPEIFASQNDGDLGVQVLDVNGDGLSDIVSARDVEIWRDDDGNEVPAQTPDATVVYEVRARTWLNSSGTGWTESEERRLPVGLVRPVIRPLNGIGIGDEEQIPGIQTISTGAQLLDLDGDRLPDVIFNYVAFQKTVSETGQISLNAVPASGAYMGSARGWNTENDAFIPPSRLDDDPAADKRQFLVEDINNDGNLDLIYAEKGKSRTLLNTGLGWTEPNTEFAIPDAAIREGKGDQGFRLLDINADMLPDIVFHWKLRNGERRGAFFNTGTGWKAGTASDAPAIPFAEHNLGDTGVRPLDVDGDGLLDIVQSFRRSKNDRDRQVQINTSPRPHLLTEVRNGLGAKVTIQYQSFLAEQAEVTDDTVRDANPTSARIAISADTHSPYPVVDSPLPGFLVQSVTAQGPGVAPRTTTYAYGGNRTDIRSGRSLGFERTETLDLERCRLTIATFSQADGLLGSPLSSETYQYLEPENCDLDGDGSRVLIARSSSEWATTARRGKAGSSGIAGFAPSILVRSLEASESESYGLDGILLEGQLAAFDYDAFGNATEVLTQFADGSGTRTVNTYDDDVERWLLARLDSATVTHFAPNRPDDVRQASFTYDPTTGLLESETAFVGTDKALVTTYERDSFGNKSGSTSARPDGSMARSQSVEFDSEGRFVDFVVNALGHRMETIYDPKSGAVTRQIDANGVAESFSYDALQRLRTRTSPTGVVTTTNVERVSGDPDVVLLTREQTRGYPETLTYSDAAGRTVRIETEGWGERPIFITSSYDELGRSKTSSLPYFEGETVYYSSREYDLLDRVIEVTRPDGEKSTKRYDGRTIISTGPTGQTATSMIDLRGRVWKTIDNMGGQTVFTFDASGRTITTTNVSGHSIVHDYDEAGNRKSLNDPSSGNWAYEYDVYGNLKLQIDPRGVRTVLEYDRLNRLRVSTATQPSPEPDAPPEVDVARWSYDEGENAIGKLVRSEWSGGDHRTYSYDEYGRPQEQYEQIGPDSLTIRDTLDAYGRLTERRYDTGVHLSHEYDYYGNLTEVTLRDQGLRRSVYELLELDALGRVKRERMGMGIGTVNEYDDVRGLLKESDTTSADGTMIQDLSLRYDIVGNLIAMSDRVTAEVNTYGFDGLNRLERATLSGRDEVKVTYDAIGNIETKSDVGTYNYCDLGPLKQMLCSTTGVDGGMQFEYDSAGNIEISGDREVEFDARGKVRSIAGITGSLLDGTSSNFRYDGDGTLITQSSVYGPEAHKYSSAFFSGVQVVRENYAPPDNELPAERTILRHALSSGTGVIGYYDKVYRHFPLRSAAPVYGQIMTPKPERVTDFRYGFSYMIKDHLGSIRAMVSETGQVLDRFRYDPWGKRIESDGYRYRNVKEGFTGHLMLDNLGLIHMGGRVYDPHLGRFMSPDPFIQAPYFSQSYNRFAYVLNNPLGFTDPSGFFFKSIGRAIGGLIGGAARAFTRLVDATVGKPLAWLGEQLAKGGRWLRQNWRTVAVIALTVTLGPAGTWYGAMLTGAAIGGFSAALYGGGPDEILRGALIGGLSAGAFHGAGVAIHEQGLNGFQAASLHGAIGGARSVAQGGKFETGFASAFVAKSASLHTQSFDSRAARVAAAAVAGGVTSEIGGGSFENGAFTGAFSQLYNGEANRKRRERALMFRTIKSVAGLNEFESELFARYWDGEGDYVLTTEQFKELSLIADETAVPLRGPLEYEIDTYETGYENGIGQANMYRAFGEWVGFRDTYDFNDKPWTGPESRPTPWDEIKTRGVRHVSPPTARPYEICYPYCSN